MNDSTRKKIAWLVILVAAFTITAVTFFDQAELVDDDRATFAILTLQAKVLVGADSMMPGTAARDLEQLDAFAVTPRLRAAVALLHAEIGGETGQKHAEKLLDKPLKPASEESIENQAHDESNSSALIENTFDPVEDGETLAALGAMERAIRDPDSLDEADRVLLSESFDFFGRLAASRGLAEDAELRQAVMNESQRLLMVFGAVLIVAGLAWLLGIALCIVALIKKLNGTLTMRFNPQPQDAALGLETFAVYLGGMLVSQVVLPLVGLAALSFPALVVASFLGLLWPKIRKHPLPFHWLGFHSGEGVLKESFYGLVGYAMILPLFSLGFFTTIILSTIQNRFASSGDAPELISHPIVVWMSEGGLVTYAAVYLIAAVFAPVFEEAMFRGAFWRGLRPSCRVITSGLVTALIFAMIHPQGWLGIPPLAALAMGFAVVREWRDSLIAPMVAHAVHNGTLVTLMMVTFAL